MEPRTYYDILGVSRDAALEEITSAKNALAKVYHPDASMHAGIDTTNYMQEILEAYHTLSDPQKRKKYNNSLTGNPNRVFRTFTVKEPSQEDTTSVSFVTYWNAAGKLYEIVGQSSHLISRPQKQSGFFWRILEWFRRHQSSYTDRHKELHTLSIQAIQYISVLKAAEIPMHYWHPEAMNWVLIRWGQKQDSDYHILFSKYDLFIESNKSNSEKMKLSTQNKQFHKNLKKLLGYAAGN